MGSCKRESFIDAATSHLPLVCGVNLRRNCAHIASVTCAFPPEFGIPHARSRPLDNRLAYRSARPNRGPITHSHPQVNGIGSWRFPNVATIDGDGGRGHKPESDALPIRARRGGYHWQVDVNPALARRIRSSCISTLVADGARE